MASIVPSIGGAERREKRKVEKLIPIQKMLEKILLINLLSVITK